MDIDPHPADSVFGASSLRTAAHALTPTHSKEQLELEIDLWRWGPRR